MSRKVTLTRKRGWFSAARALGVYVDDDKVGNLMQTRSLEIDLPEGAQQLYGKIDWAKTEAISVAGLTDGAELVVKTYFAFTPLKWFGVSGLMLRIEKADLSEKLR